MTRVTLGAADLKGVTAGVETAAVAAPAAAGEVDLSKVELPADVAAVVEGEVEAAPAAALKKKPIRAKRPAVKAE